MTRNIGGQKNKGTEKRKKERTDEQRNRGTDKQENREETGEHEKWE